MPPPPPGVIVRNVIGTLNSKDSSSDCKPKEKSHPTFNIRKGCRFPSHWSGIFRLPNWCFMELNRYRLLMERRRNLISFSLTRFSFPQLQRKARCVLVMVHTSACVMFSFPPEKSRPGYCAGVCFLEVSYILKLTLKVLPVKEHYTVL